MHRRADIEQALSPVFIRRRRKDIRDLYGDTAVVGGQPVRFPEPRLDNVAYRLDKVYAKAGSYEELIEELKKHKATRYRVTDYFTDDAKNKPEYRDLFRAKDRIAKLMAVLLLKRLESSIEAFRSTLKSLIQSNRNFREALDSSFVPIGRTATRLLSGTILRGRRPAGGSATGGAASPWSRVARGRSWSTRLRISESPIGPPTSTMTTSACTASCRALRVSARRTTTSCRWLRRFLGRRDVKAGKVLIFSEAETTIEYLYRELNPDGRNPEIARLTGSNRHDAENILKRFAPTWNLSI